MLLLLSVALAVPVELSQQGRLLDANNVPVVGSHSVAVRIFDDPEYGYVLWEEEQSISFTNGYYALFLGTDPTNALDDSLLEAEPLYVELRVDGGSPLLPRQKLVSAPYARLSGTATHVKGGNVDAQQLQIGGQLVVDSDGTWVGATPTVGWSELSGVPGALLDGDDNTQLSEQQVEDFVENDPLSLSSGSTVGGSLILTQPSTCSAGEVLLYQGNGWICGTDTDTTLTAPEVQQMIELMSLNLASLQVNGADVLTTSSSVSWSQITDIPPEILQSSDTLADLTCADGEIVTSNGGVWECSPFDTVIDADGDGVLTWNDCDDDDTLLLSIMEDGDCDGVVSADDCDDSDPLVDNGTAGLSQNCAATTCKEILDAGYSTGDGNYWLNPTGDQGVQVYCDMTTDGGGWTQIAYASDLPFEDQFSTSDTRRYLPSDFSLVLSTDQILAIQQLSTEGRQTYVGLCDNALHYFYNANQNYNYAFGFRFIDGTESVYGSQSYAPFDIVVTQDGCATNGGEGGQLSNATIFELNTVYVPIVNVNSTDNESNEPFGSPLTDNPAWLR